MVSAGHVRGGERRDLGLDDGPLVVDRADPVAEGLGQPGHQRSELEEVEQLEQRLGVEVALHEIGGADVERDVAHQDHHLDVQAGLLLVLLEVLAELGRLVRGVGEDPVEVAVRR